MDSKKYLEHFVKVIYFHDVQAPFCWGLSLLPNFQKGGPKKRLLEKRGDFFEQGERGIAVFT